MLLKACCIHVLVKGLQAFIFVACPESFVHHVPNIQYNFNKISVYMDSKRSIARLVLLAFCMRFITGVGGVLSEMTLK